MTRTRVSATLPASAQIRRHRLQCRPLRLRLLIVITKRQVIQRRPARRVTPAPQRRQRHAALQRQQQTRRVRPLNPLRPALRLQPVLRKIMRNAPIQTKANNVRPRLRRYQHPQRLQMPQRHRHLQQRIPDIIRRIRVRPRMQQQGGEPYRVVPPNRVHQKIRLVQHALFPARHIPRHADAIPEPVMRRLIRHATATALQVNGVRRPRRTRLARQRRARLPIHRAQRTTRTKPAMRHRRTQLRTQRTRRRAQRVTLRPAPAGLPFHQQIRRHRLHRRALRIRRRLLIAKRQVIQRRPARRVRPTPNIGRRNCIPERDENMRRPTPTQLRPVPRQIMRNAPSLPEASQTRTRPGGQQNSDHFRMTQCRRDFQVS